MLKLMYILMYLTGILHYGFPTGQLFGAIFIFHNLRQYDWIVINFGHFNENSRLETYVSELVIIAGKISFIILLVNNIKSVDS